MAEPVKGYIITRTTDEGQRSLMDTFWWADTKALGLKPTVYPAERIPELASKVLKDGWANRPDQMQPAEFDPESGEIKLTGEPVPFSYEDSDPQFNSGFDFNGNFL